MAIKITSVRDAVEDTGLKILIHGQAGSGKTVFCATGGVPTLIISAEAGLLSIKDAPDYIETVSISNIEDLEELAGEFEEGNPALDKYQWVCLDSISEIAEQVLSAEKSVNKDARQAYGNLSDRMFKIIRFFRDLPNRNVVMTCKQERHVDDDIGVASYVPSLPGRALTNGIAYLFDEVFAIRVEKDEDGDNYHILQCHKDRKYEAKDRSGELDEFEEPNLKRLAAKILGREIEAAPVKKPAKKKEVEEDEEQEAEDSQEVPLEEGYEIADKKMFWIHAESDSCGVIEKGEKYNAAKMDSNLAEIVSKKAYEEFKARVDADESEEDEGEGTKENPVEEPDEVSDPDKKIWVCCDCEAEYEQNDEPETCTNGDCTSTDFYEQ